MSLEGEHQVQGSWGLEGTRHPPLVGQGEARVSCQLMNSGSVSVSPIFFFLWESLSYSSFAFSLIYNLCWK